jgi:hypothetical protein
MFSMRPRLQAAFSVEIETRFREKRLKLSSGFPSPSLASRRCRKREQGAAILKRLPPENDTNS